MQFRYFVFVFFLFSSACISTNRVSTLDESARPPSVDMDRLVSTYGDVEGVFLSFEKTLEHDLKVDFTENQWRWKMYEVVDRSWVILREESDSRMFELKLPRNAELEGYQFVLRQPDNQEIILDEENLEVSQVDSDSVIYHMTYPYLARGATVSEQYEVTYPNVLKSPPVEHDVALQFAWPAEQVRFNYVYPEAWQVQLKDVGQDKSYAWQKEYLEDREAVLLTYNADQVRGFSPSPYGPFFKEVASYATLRVQSLSVGNELDWAGASSWEDVAAHYEPYSRIAGEPVPVLVREHAARLTADLNDNRKEIEAIMDFVRDRIEVADGPDEMSQVLHTRTGSPLGIAALAGGLLESRGIASQLLIAHSAHSGAFDASFFTESEFFEPVVRVELAGSPVYLFPTRPHAPLGYIPDDLVDQPALKIASQGFEGFEDLRTMSDAQTVSSDHLKIALNTEGQVVVEEEWFLGGKDALRVRKAYMTAEGIDWNRLVGEMQAYPSNMTSSQSMAVLDEGTGWDPMHIKVDYTLNGGLVVGDGDVALQTRRIAARPIDRVLPLQTDQGSVIVRAAEEHQKEILINHPERWELLTALSDISQENRYGKIAMQVSDEMGLVQVDWQQRIEPAWMNTQEALQLAEMVQAPSKQMGSMLEMGIRNPEPSQNNALPEFDPVGPWTMVVATESTRTGARKTLYQFHTKLYEKGYPVSIVEAEGPDKGFRVIVGRFITWSGLEMARVFLKSDLPYDSWVMKAPESWPGTADLAPPEAGPQQ